jgi:hypothetical protein
VRVRGEQRGEKRLGYLNICEMYLGSFQALHNKILSVHSGNKIWLHSKLSAGIALNIYYYSRSSAVNSKKGMLCKRYWVEYTNEKCFGKCVQFLQNA